MTSKSVSEYIQSLINSQRLGNQVAGHQFMEGISSHKKAAGHLVSGPLRSLLEDLGIDAFFEHQVEAIKAIRDGKHTVVATPTASGKSLIYNLSLFECLESDPQAKGLYVFPLKALTQDQYKSFEQWSRASSVYNATAAVYDGDTSAYRRKKIRQAPPNVIMTNPDMVHLSLLPHHRKWGAFFSNLKLVVIDEVHTYRGLLGSHMAQVLRRLRRVCALYGANPVFVFTSATVANPGELSHQLCGLDVTTITHNGPTQGDRHMVIMDSYDDGPAQTAILLLKAALARDLRTIVYTQSRKLAELITLWVQQKSGKWSDRVNVYRSGLLAKERRHIEQQLKNGDLCAVVSTSALELGIDIGDLDICILVGYPGSMIATWQRGGRVGRKGQTSALIMIAGQDALDQYYVAHPKSFFKGCAESAVINPYNPIVQEAHLICAASELTFHAEESWLHQEQTTPSVVNLVQKGELLRSFEGDTLHARQRRPHHKVNLRSAGKRYQIMFGEQVIGELNGYSLYREAHPGAIYLHQGITYQARNVEEDTNQVKVQPLAVEYHTKVRSQTDVQVLDNYDYVLIENTKVCIGKIRVVDQVTGYEKIHTKNGRKLGRIPLEVPAMEFDTHALWIEIPESACHQTTSQKFDLVGALHAAEHAAISIMPLLVLADRNDIGGVATPFHAQTGKATIFIYDGIPGGAGFSRLAFERIVQLLKTAASIIEGCSCKTGCPACVHSPKCGSGNQPMDKNGGLYLLKLMAKPSKITFRTEHANPAPQSVRSSSSPPTDLRYGVFDLETQRSAQEVGGWHMAHKMRVSCGVVYDALDDHYSVYLEDRVDHLIEHLKQLDVVVGFNSKRFDYKVLSGYTRFDFKQLPSLDLLEMVHRQMGFRLSLDHLAQETLSVGKSGSGLDALKWWRNGQIDKIIEYCQKDVKITRDLYIFARDKGFLVYRQKEGGRFRIPLNIFGKS